jgi:5-(carboxyamino)imidazole ribonucleotide mutase
MTQKQQAVARVAVLMGSDSDLPVMKKAVEMLRRFELEHEVSVISAHRTPDRLREYVQQAASDGAEVFVVGAGGAAHLAGVVAAHTTLPVLAVPLNATPLGGLDALLATVQMPQGIPVATVAVDGAANAALLAVSILALNDPTLASRLKAFRQDMASKVQAKSDKVKRSLADSPA